MEIKKFQNGQFGNLTTITNPKTGVTMFIAKEVADLWGHSNSRQAIKDAKLSDDEKMTITKSYYQNFFDQLRKQNLLANKTNQITLITESGLWKLALNSQKPEADSLKDWIARENSKVYKQKKLSTLKIPRALRVILNPYLGLVSQIYGLPINLQTAIKTAT